MQNNFVSMPVTIEQVALVVRNMSRKDRRRLLELVPELQEMPSMSHPAQITKDQPSVEQLQKEILATLDGQFMAPDEPFLNNLTVGEYLNLPDVERGHLWDKWTATTDLLWEEVDVHPDALPTR